MYATHCLVRHLKKKAILKLISNCRNVIYQSNIKSLQIYSNWFAIENSEKCKTLVCITEIELSNESYLHAQVFRFFKGVEQKYVPRRRILFKNYFWVINLFCSQSLNVNKSG